ncbi:potassium channel family protein [Pseudonocardia adelaidensis]|uniref:Potassium channel domain-containing protein n=1 Tax=Pseudonocardia adelaidensis TaxID=648754 RepID=A0ABP9NUT6_9PSEU
MSVSSTGCPRATSTTARYGDQVPVTTAGRLIAVALMAVGVAVLGGVAAVVALVDHRPPCVRPWTRGDGGRACDMVEGTRVVVH